MIYIYIRKATVDNIEALRGLYLALEEDGVRYQPEHFVIGERTEEFFQNIFYSDTQDILVANRVPIAGLICKLSLLQLNDGEIQMISCIPQW